MAKKAPTGSQKLYKNVGVAQLVFEDVPIEPGEEFRATLTPEHEQQLLIGGHIEILEDQSVKADRAQADAAEVGDEQSNASVTETNSSTRRRRS